MSIRMRTALIALVATLAGSPARATPFAYVVGSMNNIDVIDTATDTIVATVPAIRPLAVAVSPDGSRVYLTGDTSQVWVIDTATNTATATAPGTLAREGDAVSVHPSGTRLYVVDFNLSRQDTGVTTPPLAMEGCANGAKNPSGTSALSLVARARYGVAGAQDGRGRGEAWDVAQDSWPSGTCWRCRFWVLACCWCPDACSRAPTTSGTRFYANSTAPIDGTVYAVAVSGGNIYVGGHFTSIFGVKATNIARFDGSTWSALGSGVSGYNDTVNALAVSGSALYVGGGFTTAGGAPASKIAKFVAHATFRVAQ
jgi:YVTN family beta-propeller protein